MSAAMDQPVNIQQGTFNSFNYTMANHRLKQPDWPSFYPRDTDASLLTDIVLSHARDWLAELRVSAAAAVLVPM